MRKPCTRHWLRKILSMRFAYNFRLTGRYISTHDNKVADVLSHLYGLFHCSRFCPKPAALPRTPLDSPTCVL